MKKFLVVLGVLLLPIVLWAQAGPAVVLGWNASPTINISGYFIYRSLTSGNFPVGWVKMNPSGPTPALMFTDASVQRGTTYFYVVTAYRGSDDMESVPTNEVSATVNNPAPAPASGLRVIQIIP